MRHLALSIVLFMLLGCGSEPIAEPDAGADAGPARPPTTVGPSETMTARFTEDNPGRWLYHCHVFSHQDEGMAGWYDVEA